MCFSLGFHLPRRHVGTAFLRHAIWVDLFSGKPIQFGDLFWAHSGSEPWFQNGKGFDFLGVVSNFKQLGAVPEEPRNC